MMKDVIIINKHKRPLSVAFLIVGALLLFGSLYHAWITVDFYLIKNSTRIDATISHIEVVERAKRNRHIVYVEFELNSGELHTTTLDTFVEGMQVGDKVGIILNNNNPDEIILWWSSPLLTAIFGVPGIFIIVITLIVRERKRSKK